MRLNLTLHRIFARLSYGITHYRHPSRREAWRLANSIPRRIPTLTTPLECAEIYAAVSACADVDGDIAEVGVYRGGTAAILLSASPKHLHLFDTFAGLPSGDRQFEQGEFVGSVEAVAANLAEWAPRFSLHRGLFPESATGLEGLRFSFVHLDLDLYQSTIDSLRWLWPRMSQRGVIVSHDYPFSDGVVRAFREFTATVPSFFLPLSGNQCLMLKP